MSQWKKKKRKIDEESLLGLGNDIIEINRIRQSVETHGLRLISRLFTTKEQDYCFKFKDPIPHFAGRFAAKEAIAKALGTGFGEHISWHDIEILKDELGKPYPIFSSRLNKRFQFPHLILSISHCHEYATAVAIWVSKQQG